MKPELGWLAFGGVAGTFARYFLSGWMTRMTGSYFPAGTLLVNALGCLVLGFFAVIAEQKGLNVSVKLLIFTGFCGAFTTFSALIFESWALFRQEGPGLAFCNIGISLLAGFVFLAAGFWAGRLYLQR